MGVFSSDMCHYLDKDVQYFRVRLRQKRHLDSVEEAMRYSFFALEDSESPFLKRYVFFYPGSTQRKYFIRIQLFRFALSAVLYSHRYFSFTRLLLIRMFVRPAGHGLLYTVLYRWTCGLFTAFGNLSYCNTFMWAGIA
jgi:hypothetical protein